MKQRYAMVIGLEPDKVEEYKRLHAAAWPEVLRKIRECHLRNFSIYLRQLPPAGDYFLFSYYEYIGTDYEADVAKIAADPTTQEWWSHCNPCQRPLPDRAKGEWWAAMEEVFHAE